MTDQLYTQSWDSPIGLLTIESDHNGIKRLLYNQVVDEFKNAITEEAILQLKQYFQGDRTSFDLPLHPVGTAFELNVWKHLQEIPYGKTVSYGELSRNVSTIKAVRAIGRANGKNPIPIIIPCHRVIGADGSLTGFALGIECKRMLLELENPLKYNRQLTLF